jgi:probable HAF family extracellular repeat protein
MNVLRVCAGVALAATMSLGLQSAEPPAVVDLGTLGGPFSSANAVNDRNQVVGISYIDAISLRAFLWEEGRMIQLPSLDGGASSSANGINDKGQIVGSASDAAFKVHAVLWEDGRITDLGELPGALNCSATAIDNHGHVVGSCDGVEGGGFFWRDGTMTPLGALPGRPLTYPTSINDHDVVVGAAINPEGEPRAFRWEAGVLTDLGEAGLLFATSINERGQITGSSSLPAFVNQAVLWTDGRLVGLGIPPGASYSQAFGLNNRGEIVGRTSAAPFIWSRGVMRALPVLQEGAVPLAINDRGVAVGQGGGTTPGEAHALLWPKSSTRVPLPASQP